MILNTLPIAVLFFLFIGEFNIIKTLLNPECITLWKMFGWALGVMGGLNLAYALFLIIRKQNVSVYYGAIALFSFIVYLYLYLMNFDKIIPFTVPQWMLGEDMLLYVGTFLMPTLAYSLFVIIVHFTDENKSHKAWVNFLVAVMIPIAGYIFSQIILPLWYPVDSVFARHLFTVFFIIGTLVFLFFLVRAIYILARKKSHVWLKYQLLWKIPISILLPLVGLAVNNGVLFNSSSSDFTGIFGDFNNTWFYILAIVNGIFICLPNFENKRYRLFLFIGRSITFAYTLYFFIVFLPFLPLSVVAIIAAGVGFLMLTPLVLLVIHINEITKDFTYLQGYFSKKIIWVYSVLGFLVIPMFITVSFINEKLALNETLAYIYTPDYSKSYKIDKERLQQTLDVLSYHKQSRGNIIFGSQIPYLSAWYNWIVLDNMTLSDDKINTIKHVFYGDNGWNSLPENLRNDSVKVTKINSSSIYQKEQKAWLSTVDMEITNGTNNNLSEFATTIDLPEGCWISDYYLYVGGKKEMGLLSEKKSAMWVFNQIRRINQYPGILYYLTGNRVAFRIYPFEEKEVRKTGIEFLHKDPVSLTIEGNNLQLGDSMQHKSEVVETINVVYVPASKKQTLKKVQRKPYFHFLVDVSNERKGYSQKSIRQIEQLKEKHKPLFENAKISFVNSYVETVPMDSKWKQLYQSKTFESGFYLDRAIKTTLFKSYTEPDMTYPVMVVVTDTIKSAVLGKDFSDFKRAFPDNSLFFVLMENGMLEPHSLISNPRMALTDSISYAFGQMVLEYRLLDNTAVYLPDDNQPSIIQKTKSEKIDESTIKEKSWQSALIMQGVWNAQILHPETSGEEWLNLVKYSFMAKVMTPVTSYIVVENEAQKAMLKKKQKQVLAGNKSLDMEESPDRMSEPGLLVVALLFGLVLWLRRKRKRLRIEL